MTTTSLPAPSPTGPPSVGPASAGRPAARSAVARRAVAGAAILGTLPYLGLKAMWLTGNPVGTVDPTMLDSTSMRAFNGVTVGMDLCVILLAVALTAAWGRRLPAPAVLLPAWVATGFLLPIAISVLPGMAVTGVDGAGSDGLAGWVRPMVYGGFGWQGLFLLVAFALYATDHRSRA